MGGVVLQFFLGAGSGVLCVSHFLQIDAGLFMRIMDVEEKKEKQDKRCGISTKSSCHLQYFPVLLCRIQFKVVAGKYGGRLVVLGDFSVPPHVGFICAGASR